MIDLPTPHLKGTEQRGPLYAAVWRWHFYAGLFVAPFFLIAALSGIVMALKTPIEALAYGDRLYVTAQEAILNPSDQMASVLHAYPHSEILTYIPPKTSTNSAQFMVATHSGHHQADHGSDHSGGDATTIYVNQYTGAVLGSLDPSKTLYSYARKLHGSLFMGSLGDYLIEIAAGFGIVLIVTGLFLWTPRGGQSLTSALTPKLKQKNRAGWRGLHAPVGFWVSFVMLFFLFSGLSWTPFWGGKLVQAWSSFPAARLAAPVSDLSHDALNLDDQRNVPWALEQTPLPVAHVHGQHKKGGLDLDEIVALAHAKGFTGFRVHFPKAETGAWTIAAATISADISDPRRDRTIHVNASTGEIIADIGFADYSLMGKAMAAGVPLHQGDLGAWNISLNVVFCLAVITMIISGVAMWLLRRPKKSFRLAPPPTGQPSWRSATLVMLAVSAFFPLTAAAIALVICADYLFFSQLPKLARAKT